MYVTHQNFLVFFSPRWQIEGFVFMPHPLRKSKIVSRDSYCELLSKKEPRSLIKKKKKNVVETLYTFKGAEGNSLSCSPAKKLLVFSVWKGRETFSMVYLSTEKLGNPVLRESPGHHPVLDLTWCMVGSLWEEASLEVLCVHFQSLVLGQGSYSWFSKGTSRKSAA